MRESGRGYEDSGSRRKPNDKLCLPENELAPFIRIKVPKCCDGTKAKWTVEDVTMLEAADLATKVETSARPCRAFKRGPQLRVVRVEFLEVFAVVLMEFWRPQPKGPFTSVIIVCKERCRCSSPFMNFDIRWNAGLSTRSRCIISPFFPFMRNDGLVRPNP
jgi:hypothetical protein